MASRRLLTEVWPEAEERVGGSGERGDEADDGHEHHGFFGDCGGSCGSCCDRRDFDRVQHGGRDSIDGAVVYGVGSKFNQRHHSDCSDGF